MMSLRRAQHVPTIRLLFALVFAASCLSLCAAPAASARQTTPRFTVTDLGPFTPRGVNEMGQVTGVAIIDGHQYAVLWDGTFKTINPPGSAYAQVGSINNHGQVSGSALFCDIVDGNCVNARTLAFVYSAGKFTLLGTLGGRDSFGGDINDAGLVVGHSFTAGSAPNISGDEQAFASSGGALEDLGAKMGVGGSLAGGVNSLGQVAGRFGDRNGVGAFLYDTRNGSFTLFNFNGSPDDVNDLGQMVGGLSGNDDGSGRAFLYAGGALKNLGTLKPAHTFSRAWAVNNAGQIVGISNESFFTRGDERAFLYESGAMLDLNALIPAGTGWVLNEATDINGQGQIVGAGHLNGVERAFMLTPAGPPVLLTEPDSATALALDSVTFERGPFTLASPHNFSLEGRRRLTLLARNVEFAPGEDAQQLSVRAEGPAGEPHLLPVEHVGRVPGFPSLTQINVRLTDDLAAGDYQLSLTLRGATSNKATLSLSAF